MSTGIKVSDECIAKCNSLRLGNQFRYIILGFNDQLTHVVVNKISPPDASHDDFLDDLPLDQVCYAIYNFQFESDDGQPRTKTIFVIWAPRQAPLKMKMVVAGTALTVKSSIPGIQVEMQGGTHEELSVDHVTAKVKSASH